MKIILADDRIPVFEIKTKREYNRVMKLEERLSNAIKSTGWYYVDTSVFPGEDFKLIEEAKEYHTFIINSIMHYNYMINEYMGGHDYGGKVKR